LDDIAALPPANMDILLWKALIKNCKYMKLYIAVRKTGYKFRTDSA
jgi:hypothetical protein